MDNSVWLKMWEDNNTGWHEIDVNTFLEKNYDLLKDSSTIFIPLCGKTLDIPWLVSHGHKVIGCELSGIAIKELFETMQINPEVKKIGDFKKYSGGDVTIFEGDFFHLTKELLGDVDVVYDRGALVALNVDLRVKYTQHLKTITNSVCQFIILYNYDQQSRGNFPPYSISKDELDSHYGEFIKKEKVDTIYLENGIDGDGCIAKEEVWYLRK